MILCRDPNGGYARYVCPGCGFDRRVPFSCKTRFCPSCGKVKVDNWVSDIARDLFDVPHLHVTLTVDDLLWPFFHAHRSLLKVLLKTASQAVRELVQDLYPGIRIGMIYTLHRYARVSDVTKRQQYFAAMQHIQASGPALQSVDGETQEVRDE